MTTSMTKTLSAPERTTAMTLEVGAMNRGLTYLMLALTFVLLAPGGALAKGETNLSQGLTAKGPGLAVHGYDVVSYFTAGEPALGYARHSTVYQEATYRFANAENLKRFKKDPASYAPQFGGYCAFGVSVGKKFVGDPEVWRIVDGKLYLNLDVDIQSQWLKDVPGRVKTANAKWLKIKNVSPSQL